MQGGKQNGNEEMLQVWQREGRNRQRRGFGQARNQNGYDNLRQTQEPISLPQLQGGIKMSCVDTIEVEGKLDLGTITPLELLTFCLKNKVNRINSLFQLYAVEGEDCEVDVEQAVEAQDKGKKITPLNRWQIDYN